MWRHIPRTLNATDLVSRGCSGEHLLQGKWWEGPTWLLENEENWPKSEEEPDEDLVNSEKRKTIVTVLTKTAENVNWYFKLLIMNVHNDLLHAGTSMLMSHLREKYRIIKARKTIRNCIRKCVKCQRFNAKKCDVTPGILPKDCLRDAATFEIVGVDLEGPLYLKHDPKAYIVLYTWAVYRAIHLELITSLTTEAFLQSLRRFISRRGRPTAIYSDNGTNFKGAERLLHALDWDSILARVAEEKIQWTFNPPSAPWWERLVQMTKATLRKILGCAALDYEELITVLCDCDPLQTPHLRVRRR
ncbi:integrase catalytic domain-containing protein [Trichonephila clavipes]|nr:integrase catalytic domain-containing protein [Trichonephila clavipes]